MTRSEAREQAFVLIFDKMFNSEVSAEELKANACESEFLKPDEFTDRLFSAESMYEEEIDSLIAPYLKGWTIQRIPKVSLAILRLAATEIIYFDDIPDSASVNEAVELAKKYGGSYDASFINGVLGSVIKDKVK